MTVVRVVGTYQISVTKEDKVNPDWDVVSFGFGTAGCFFLLLVAAWSAGVQNDHYIALFEMIIGVGVLLVSHILPGKFGKCGVKIEIVDDHRYVTTLQFSGDTEKDANRIKEKIDYYVKIATVMTDDKTAIAVEKHKKETECCEQFQTVMEKVNR